MQWELRGDRPIYQQLVEKLTEQIVSGQLAAGEKIPPVRELAAQAGVNPNTMQRALAQLEQTGLLYTRRTSGRFVTEDETVIQEARLNLARERAEEFLRARAQLGYDRQAALQLLRGGEESDAHGGSDL